MNAGLQFAVRNKQTQGSSAWPVSYKTGIEVKAWMVSEKSSMKASHLNRNSNNKVNSMSLVLAGMCGLCPSPIWPLDSPYLCVRKLIPEIITRAPIFMRFKSDFGCSS